ncbi:serine/threonine protein kinase [Stieleria sp. TO1_6]|uniref:serine/threonine-protein kinase n=1 Tax=Stieleria tagensis TaxID=2956795 RepID=UPI00209A8A49|nr:serine/threonine-protein kinase [Stieleria tagensis]MCO8122001.1 serine/threonine protein kinase [Stieleria tagensis]
MNQLDDTHDGRVIAAVKYYMQLQEEGNAPSTESFLQQYTEIADKLRPALEGLMMVHRAADPKPAGLIAPDAEFMAKPIGDFQIVGELGRGGMGVVYEAIQLSLGRHVALKVLPMASGLDEIRLQRFRNEAHAAAALHHTNIVPVYAVGSDRGIHYYAMQLIDGSTLADLIATMLDAQSGAGSAANSAGGEKSSKSGPQNDTIARHSTLLSDGTASRGRYYRSVVKMVQQAAMAIEHAHQYGVVHRDIKPANLLLDSSGKIWVTDFGLAQVQADQTQLTRTGDPMGTLRYMSPEQAAGRRDQLDHRTDIYSLGVTLYELLTLQPAIDGDGYREMLNKVALYDPPAPRSIDPQLPTELDTIVRKAIAKTPSERYSSAGALADDLQAWIDDKPIAAKPPSLLERLAKWRRRNSGLVAVASGLLLLVTLGLLATTLVIWNEQRHTAQALGREMQQRIQAQRSFDQALSAVDTFSNLSESELAYHPDLQDLRRSFLETSLAFYKDFLNDRADDPALAQELSASSARVQQMVDELQVLDNIAPLLQLNQRSVQDELGIDDQLAYQIEQGVDQFRDQRESLANRYVGGLAGENDQMSELVNDFDAFISDKLSDQQLNRLRQISRQRRLPFTFKTSEVVAALGLTRQQRDEINRIIEQTRPNPGGRPDGPDDFRDGPRGDRPGEFRRRPPPGDGPPSGRVPEGPRPPEFFDGRRPPDGPWRPEFGGRRPPDGPGPRGFDDRGFDDRGPPGGPPQRSHDDRRPPLRESVRLAATKITVAEIVKILTPQQRATWNELIGEPFDDDAGGSR